MAFWITVVITLVLDRAGKLLTLAYLAQGSQVVVWARVLEWRLIYNRGMAFGFLSGFAWAGMLLPLAAVTVGWLLIRRYRLTRFMRLVTGLVIGGFLGNYLDRLLTGQVVDMIYLPWMPWFICNVADIAICAGAVLLGVSLLFRPQDWELKSEENAHEANHPDRHA